MSDFRWTRREKPLLIWYTSPRRGQEEEMTMRSFGKLSGLLMLLLLSVTSCKSYQWSGSDTVICNGHFIMGADPMYDHLHLVQHIRLDCLQHRRWSNDPTLLRGGGRREEFRGYSCDSPCRCMSRPFRHLRSLHRLLNTLPMMPMMCSSY